MQGFLGFSVASFFQPFVCFLVYLYPLFSFFRVTPYSGAGAHGIARARGEPSDNLCSQRAEDGSPLVRAQSEATLPQPGRPSAKTPHPTKPITPLKTSAKMAATSLIQ